MTEQEADAMLVRLTRIWMPAQEISYRLEPEGRFKFTGQLDEEGDVSFFIDNWLGILSIDFYVGEIQSRLAANGELNVWTLGNAVAPVITERWLPYFRRNAWLSGFPVEASGHEKAEWMRGFSSEEIEAWNLQT